MTAYQRRNHGYALTETMAADKVGHCPDCGAALLIDPDGQRTAVLAYECPSCDDWLTEADAAANRAAAGHYTETYARRDAARVIYAELLEIIDPLGELPDVGGMPSPSPAPPPDGIHPCPTCGRIGCERCLGLGRQQWARVTASDSHDGRATIEIWFGPGGTMEMVATNQQTLAHDRVDLLLATLNEAPGVIVRDRRAAR